MDKFGRWFYDFIYGTIHHHDYAPDRAEELIRIYGKVKFLEVGCGCGILVKELRDRGADAWGIDVSDYAISENCAGEFVQKSDAQNIPFDDGYFDVVHSWAMFGYNTEQETEQIIKECNRVGRNQYHTIDYQISLISHMRDNNYPYGYIFMKPREWFDERIKNEG